LSFHHADTGTWSHVVADATSSEALIIDPVLNYDLKSGRIGTAPAQILLNAAAEEGYRIAWILETHAHADHLSAAAWLKHQLRAQGEHTSMPRIGIGEGIRSVQRNFKALFNLEPDFAVDGSQFDRLFADGERFPLGDIEAQVIAVPGHTEDSLAYLIGDALFVGDSLFMPDSGTARCDFPGGDAATLYRSIQRLYRLADDTRVFVCHDYAPAGREPHCETSIAEQKADNLHARVGVGEAEFVALRRARDAGLALPQLMLPAVQVNIRAGELPPPENNGLRYLKIPLDAF
jgi:glyoxylase-like metal-dependent hydrolase (beta-lactamase superfamily II)